MKKKPAALAMESDFPVDLTLHNFPASLLSEFAEKIATPYYAGNLNVAIQDLMHKTISEQDFILAHITHVRSKTTALQQEFVGGEPTRLS